MKKNKKVTFNDSEVSFRRKFQKVFFKIELFNVKLKL